MRAKDVQVGAVYTAKVSGVLTTVRIKNERYGGSGWVGVNEKTGREVRIRTAARLRSLVLSAKHSGFRMIDTDYEEAREREFASSLMVAPGVPSFIDGETAQEREDRLIAAAPSRPLVAKWCDCGSDTGFRCYPGDGECECGMHKHHVHGTCGHVTQVG
jgi:hypothetical protein